MVGCCQQLHTPKQPVSAKLFKQICEALALQRNYQEAEKINPLIPETDCDKYAYLKPICETLIKEGNAPQALAMAGKIPDAHSSKKISTSQSVLKAV
jgi:hypothetical protein